MADKTDLGDRMKNYERRESDRRARLRRTVERRIVVAVKCGTARVAVLATTSLMSTVTRYKTSVLTARTMS